MDTRPYCNALNDLISLNAETGERGNPVWGNLPRKFNIAVSGGRDDYAHTHINDIGFQPYARAHAVPTLSVHPSAHTRPLRRCPP